MLHLHFALILVTILNLCSALKFHTYICVYTKSWPLSFFHTLKEVVKIRSFLGAFSKLFVSLLQFNPTNEWWHNFRRPRKPEISSVIWTNMGHQTKKMSTQKLFNLKKIFMILFPKKIIFVSVWKNRSLGPTKNFLQIPKKANILS